MKHPQNNTNIILETTWGFLPALIIVLLILIEQLAPGLITKLGPCPRW
jgi:hypothetical protein